MSRKKELKDKRKEIALNILNLIEEYHRYIDEKYIDDTPTKNRNYQIDQLKQLIKEKIAVEKKNWMPELKKQKKQAKALDKRRKAMAKKLKDFNDPDAIDRMAEILFGGQ